VSRYVWDEFNGSGSECFEPVYQLKDTNDGQTVALIIPSATDFELLFLDYRKNGKAGLASRPDLHNLKFSTLEEAQAVSLAIVTLT
jgi:hypothetical protein